MCTVYYIKKTILNELKYSLPVTDLYRIEQDLKSTNSNGILTDLKIKINYFQFLDKYI